MSHRNARPTPFARRLIVERVQQGQPVAHVAKAMGTRNLRRNGVRWLHDCDPLTGELILMVAVGEHTGDTWDPPA